MMSAVVVSSTPSRAFAVADQERHGVYRVHTFDSWDHFRLWCRAHRPKHMLPTVYAHGSRLRPDIDHCGEHTLRMADLEAGDARRDEAVEQAEAAHCESVERRQIHRLGHDADVDLVALADAAQATKAARLQARKSIRSMTGFFNWCTANNINFDFVPHYLGMSLRQWTQQNADQSYDRAAQLMLDRRDGQVPPVEAS
jgi:hypothetical protein